MRVVLSLSAGVCLSALLLAQGSGWRASSGVIARALAQHPDANYDESRVPPYTLPELLKGREGPIVTTTQWTSRREELLNLFRDNVYGRSPGPPEHIDFTVLDEDRRAIGGAATLRRISIVSRQALRSHRFELTLFTPNKPAAVPVFVLINNRPASNTDPSRKEKS